MKFKFLTVMCLAALLTLLAVSVSAQDMPTPSVTVGDQVVLGGFVTINSIYSEGPGFVVIHRASDGGVVGVSQPLIAGWTNNLRIPIDVTKAEATMSGMLHVDDGVVGTYEFGTVEGADSPVKVGDQIVNTLFNAQVLSAGDQKLDGSSVTIGSVTVPVDSWVVVHSTSKEGFTFGGVLGETLVKAGTTPNVKVELSGDMTSAVWPMLHVDDGVAGTYEFGTVEGKDAPVVIGGQVASFPIWTAPHLRVKDQIVLHGDGMTPSDSATVKVDSVVSDGPGIVVIHANDNGNAGAILGATFVPDGLSKNITVELDTTAGITPVVWPMLHTDGGDVGTYVDNTIDPPVSVDGAVVTFTSNIAPALVVEDQAITKEEGEDPYIVIKNALIDAPGWVAIHADKDGAPGEVIGTAILHAGANWNVEVAVDPAKAGTKVWPMLHYDDHAMGTYEFGTVDGADAPVFVSKNVIFVPMNITAS
jgi:hypothetical protein